MWPRSPSSPSSLKTLKQLVLAVCSRLSPHTHRYELIQKAELRIPSFVSSRARTLLTELLVRNPKDRLGFGEVDVEAVKTNVFFGDLNWVNLYERKIKPSFVPKVKSGTDTSNFDAEFTSEPVVDSVVQGSALSDAKGADFKGFTFQEDSAMG